MAIIRTPGSIKDGVCVVSDNARRNMSLQKPVGLMLCDMPPRANHDANSMWEDRLVAYDWFMSQESNNSIGRKQNEVSVETLLRERRADILSSVHRRGARNVRIFGSVARGEANDDSDIDLLVDVGDQTTPWFRAALVEELESMLGRPVDVVTENSLLAASTPYRRCDKGSARLSFSHCRVLGKDRALYSVRRKSVPAGYDDSGCGHTQFRGHGLTADSVTFSYIAMKALISPRYGLPHPEIFLRSNWRCLSFSTHGTT
jgi:predicted nucleotidyltransferase